MHVTKIWISCTETLHSLWNTPSLFYSYFLVLTDKVFSRSCRAGSCLSYISFKKVIVVIYCFFFSFFFLTREELRNIEKEPKVIIINYNIFSSVNCDTECTNRQLQLKRVWLKNIFSINDSKKKVKRRERERRYKGGKKRKRKKDGSPSSLCTSKA